MADSKYAFYYTLKIDTKNIPNSLVEQAAKEVGEHLIDETIRYVRSGTSPVRGHGAFPVLSKDYAEENKGGNRTANITVDGSTMENLEARVVYNVIKIGHFKGKDAAVADGHNQITARSKAWARKRKYPLRRWVPSREEKYKPAIMRGVEQILDNYRVDQSEAERVKEANKVNNRLKIVGDRRIEESVDITSVFDDDLIRKIIFGEITNGE